MNIIVLGCHGSDGFPEVQNGFRPCNTCAFLLNGTILIDAGTIASALSLKDQKLLRHVLLSHLHFDHIRGLPTLADNLSEHAHKSIIVAGLPSVVDGLRRHIFNTDVYPDFFAIPSTEHPILTPHYLKPGTSYSISGITATPITVNHTVPTVGFIVDDRATAFVYSGDTCSTEEIWHEAKRLPHLKAAFIECSFPDSMMDLALRSKHLTPSLFAKECEKLGRDDITIYAYHLKTTYKSQIKRALEALNIPNLVVLEEGMTVTI